MKKDRNYTPHTRIDIENVIPSSYRGSGFKACVGGIVRNSQGYLFKIVIPDLHLVQEFKKGIIWALQQEGLQVTEEYAYYDR